MAATNETDWLNVFDWVDENEPETAKYWVERAQSYSSSLLENIVVPWSVENPTGSLKSCRSSNENVSNSYNGSETMKYSVAILQIV